MPAGLDMINLSSSETDKNFFVNLVKTEEINELLQSLTANKALEVDSIPLKLVKLAAIQRQIYCCQVSPDD